MFQSLRDDMWLAVRDLRRSPGFAATVIGTLSVGLAFNVVLFSMLHAVHTPELPYADPSRILVVTEAFPPNGWTQQPVSLGTFEAVTSTTRSLEAVGTYTQRRVSVAAGESRVRLPAAIVSSGVWTALGVRPALGRAFTAGEDRAGAPPVAIIGQAVWRDRFGMASAVLGRRLTVDGTERTIVGVMPEDFRFPENEQIWLPLGSVLDADAHAFSRRDLRAWELVARLKPDATPVQVAGELDGLSAQLEREFPDQHRGWLLGAISIADQSRVATGGFFAGLQAAGVLLVLIMCANLGNLLLARGEQRRRDRALMSALGATRLRLARTMLLQVGALAAVAAAIAVLAGAWAIELLPRAIPEAIPYTIRFRIDLTVVSFAIAVAAAAALAAGAGAMMRTTGAAPHSLLAAGTLSLVTAPGAGWTRGGFLFVQTSLAATLLTTALVLASGTARIGHLDLGFRPAGAVLMEVPLTGPTYDDPGRVRDTAARILEALDTAPDVAAAGAIAAVPLAPAASGTVMETAGAIVSAAVSPGTYRAVTPGYLEAAGLTLTAGRFISASDTAGAEPVVVLNEEAAQQLFGGASPLGQRVRFGRSEEARPWRTIVGVVRNTIEQPLDPEIDARLLVPFAQDPARHLTVVARATGAATRIVPLLVSAVHHADPAVAPEAPETWTDRLATAIWPVRFVSRFAGVAALFGMVVACSGVYGLTHYLTLARRREMALRLSLGATPGAVLRLLVRQGATAVAAGLLTGMGMALLLSNLLRHLVIGMPAFAPGSFAAAFVALAVTSVLAIGVPASQVLRMAPADALRD